MRFRTGFKYTALRGFLATARPLYQIFSALYFSFFCLLLALQFYWELVESTCIGSQKTPTHEKSSEEGRKIAIEDLRIEYDILALSAHQRLIQIANDEKLWMLWCQNRVYIDSINVPVVSNRLPDANGFIHEKMIEVRHRPMLWVCTVCCIRCNTSLATRHVMWHMSRQ